MKDAQCTDKNRIIRDNHFTVSICDICNNDKVRKEYQYGHKLGMLVCNSNRSVNTTLMLGLTDGMMLSDGFALIDGMMLEDGTMLIDGMALRDGMELNRLTLAGP